MQPGEHRISMEDYLAIEAVSASDIRTMVQRCPRAAWWGSWLNPIRPPDESSPQQDLGSIAHALLLQGDGSGIVTVDAPDWRTKAARELRDATHAAGKMAILDKDMQAVTAMAGEAHAYIESLRETEPAIWQAFQADVGDSELSMVFDCDGTLCKIRPDRISADRGLIIDYKTGRSSAEPSSWGKGQMVRMGHYIGAAFYRIAIHLLTGGTPDYVWLVQEVEPPYLCSLVAADPHALDLGRDKCAWALDTWRECVESDAWPGYPNRVAHVELPNWEQWEWEAREGAEG